MNKQDKDDKTTKTKDNIDIITFLNEIPILKGISDQVILDLSLNSTIKHFNKRNIIYKAGEPANWFYLVYLGQIAEFVSYKGSVEVIVKTKKKFEYLGEMGILINEPYPNTSIALEKLILIGIPKDYFWKLASENLSVLQHINKELINRLVNSSRKNISTMYLDAPGKLAFTLLKLCESSSQVNDGLKIYITHNELGATAGMARQTASVLLSKWSKEGILNTSRGRIDLIDIDALMDIIIDSELK